MRTHDGQNRVIRYLERWIRTAGPDTALPSVRQICRDCGVSLSTLSVILKDYVSQNRLVVRARKGIFTPPAGPDDSGWFNPAA